MLTTSTIISVRRLSIQAIRDGAGVWPMWISTGARKLPAAAAGQILTWLRSRLEVLFKRGNDARSLSPAKFVHQFQDALPGLKQLLPCLRHHFLRQQLLRRLSRNCGNAAPVANGMRSCAETARPRYSDATSALPLPSQRSSLASIASRTSALASCRSPWRMSNSS